jgi:Protein of unknown function (DUF3309)
VDRDGVSLVARAARPLTQGSEDGAQVQQGRWQEGSSCDARDEARCAAQRTFWTQGQESQASGRYRARGGAARREEGTPEEEIAEAAMLTILLIVLVLILIGALPTWPYSAGWGYYPSGGIGLIVIVLVVLLLMGRI